MSTQTTTSRPVGKRTREFRQFAPEAEIPTGSFLIRTLADISVGVTRLKDGSLKAVRDWCPHKGAPICRGTVSGTWLPSQPGELEYGREGEILACPWHGFEYDLDSGKELYRTIPTRLRFYDTEVRDGIVWVSV